MLDWSDVLRFTRDGNPTPPRRDERTEAEWRDVLPPDVFFVTRKAGTERPFSSEMCSLFEPGVYGCVCCGTRLFDASEKFESGTGWPSFTQPLEEDVVAHHMDASHGMRRVEVTCNVCDAHLGHVFPDGPGAGGLRYCINALSLTKKGQD
ncbi:MAG TPA: peptide-methionine (R)-S-oxide reductase MsrB [Longimicrobiales bacterium]|nr:peptide-methionine (R)-S-oxide reductase MsrB [Longimicrobiales bacterium]